MLLAVFNLLLVIQYIIFKKFEDDNLNSFSRAFFIFLLILFIDMFLVGFTIFDYFIDLFI